MFIKFPIFILTEFEIQRGTIARPIHLSALKYTDCQLDMRIIRIPAES